MMILTAGELKLASHLKMMIIQNTLKHKEPDSRVYTRMIKRIRNIWSKMQIILLNHFGFVTSIDLYSLDKQLHCCGNRLILS